MGAAVTAVWLVTGAARAAISHLVDVMDEPLPRTDVLRFATALNYTLLGLSGMGVLALCILAISMVVTSTLQENATREVLAQAGLMLDSAAVIRSYTETEIGPLLDDKMVTAFKKGLAPEKVAEAILAAVHSNPAVRTVGKDARVIATMQRFAPTALRRLGGSLKGRLMGV